MTMRHSIGVVCLGGIVFLACGTSSSNPATDGGGDDATNGDGCAAAGGVCTCIGACGPGYVPTGGALLHACPAPPPNSGVCSTQCCVKGTTRVPSSHRPTANACPHDRGPGMIDPGCTGDGGPGVGCTNDAACTMGQNGRCYTNAGGVRCPGNACSYDQCFVDGDCMNHLACDCRAPEAHDANVCATGSNCRVDADCGAGGYCSRSAVPNCSFAYFCHTPNDACVDNADCADGGVAATCAYDDSSKSWRCRTDTCLPAP